MNITPVLAENHKEFTRFIRMSNLNKGHFAYITNQSERLRGYRGLVLTVGYWWHNVNYSADFHQNLEALARRGEVSVVKGLSIVTDKQI